jgi:hypothetical protein
MDEDKKTELVVATKEDAIALVEDYEHMHQILGETETKPTDLRHASAILRRWLVEKQLVTVASPRVGRLQLQAIDNNPVYRVERKGVIQSFVSGGASIHGVYIAGGMKSAGNRSLSLPDYHPDTLITMTVDTFLNQRVIYTEGTWVNRRQVIKFVANVGHGVHGGKVKEDWEGLLDRFRFAISVTVGTGPDGKTMPSIAWSEGQPGHGRSPEKYDPRKVNGVLLELLASIWFLVRSRDVENLVGLIRANELT